MDKQVTQLIETLNLVPEISFEVPEILIRLNEEGVTLGELDEGMPSIEQAVELIGSHHSASEGVQRKLLNLPPRTIANGIPIGF